MIGYMKISEVSEKWGIEERRINKLCLEGRIEGAVKFGTTWAYLPMLKNLKMRELSQCLLFFSIIFFSQLIIQQQNENKYKT